MTSVFKASSTPSRQVVQKSEWEGVAMDVLWVRMTPCSLYLVPPAKSTDQA